MKNLIFTLFALFIFCTSYGQNDITSVGQNDTISVATLTYSGQSPIGYYFSNPVTEEVVEFKYISKEALDKYEFKNKKLIGKKFTISYYEDYDEIPAVTQNEAASIMRRLTIIDLNMKNN